MLSILLQDRAALYVAGLMPRTEQECFEQVLQHHDELRQWVAQAQQAGAAMALADVSAWSAPSPNVKTRLLRSIAQVRRPAAPDALVVTDAAGHIDWVSDAFTKMCGYGLAELRGRKPSTILQGAATDRSAIERLRTAIRAAQPARETLVNYHKDGSSYVVDVQILPVLDESGRPVWFFAQERELLESAAAKA